MRRITWTAALVLCLTLIVTACGTKDAESVIKDLDKVIGNLESYQGSGTMTLHTGQSPAEYRVEVAYQKPESYRIKLTNEEKDISQIVLRNEEGVFVLTPKLNKVFRFQSEWPQNQGQVYLYQTLVQSILLDGSRQFAVEDDSYVFDVMGNYNNGTFARQKIWLSQNDYTPLHVEVSDNQARVLVEVKFDEFAFNAKFEDNYFDTNANLSTGSQNKAGDQDKQKEEPATSEQKEQPSSEQDGDKSGEKGEEQQPASGEEEQQPASSEEEPNGSQEGAEEGAENQQAEETGAAVEPTGSDVVAQRIEPFTIMEPTYYPVGVAQSDIMDIEYGGSPGVLSRYEGTYSYSLLQTQPHDVATTLVPGTIHDLGFTMGELTVGEAQQTLTWTYGGSQFRLTSSDLPEVELIRVAQSIETAVSK